MEVLDELSKSNGKPGFFKHVFNFNDDSKAKLLNIIQYSILALIPVIILNKLMQNFVPEANDDKSSIELLFEILAQILSMFLGILFIDRIITYIPTYSGDKYLENNFITIVLPVLVILLSLQTKLGEKVSILYDRISELWNGNGTTNKKQSNKNQSKIKVSQPISQNSISQMPLQNQMTINQSLSSTNDTTSINSLPMQQQFMQDTNTQLNDMQSQEPMAANSAFGGFGNAFW
jgi:hypothetical protein